ncbi:hypothetical protein BHYA_0026g00140 [Botrytis hyacinthi]|uniref:Uncharacterized protein n=1 Tax=Botrytis hyacinthi TaxID=278943 RepID=A0A4Z1GX60_9HELO|nr:hypothetical protein BHYA_0026g00140 [Botrytis hyacinthi]
MVQSSHRHFSAIDFKISTNLFTAKSASRVPSNDGPYSTTIYTLGSGNSHYHDPTTARADSRTFESPFENPISAIARGRILLAKFNRRAAKFHTTEININFVNDGYNLSDFAPDQTHWNMKCEGVPRFVSTLLVL